ncbi:hypothetical protein YB2330_005948 [Saitoella coloradoensis]
MSQQLKASGSFVSHRVLQINGRERSRYSPPRNDEDGTIDEDDAALSGLTEEFASGGSASPTENYPSALDTEVTEPDVPTETEASTVTLPTAMMLSMTGDPDQAAEVTLSIMAAELDQAAEAASSISYVEGWSNSTEGQSLSDQFDLAHHLDSTQTHVPDAQTYSSVLHPGVEYTAVETNNPLPHHYPSALHPGLDYVSPGGTPGVNVDETSGSESEMFSGWSVFGSEEPCTREALRNWAEMLRRYIFVQRDEPGSQATSASVSRASSSIGLQRLGRACYLPRILHVSRSHSRARPELPRRRSLPQDPLLEGHRCVWREVETVWQAYGGEGGSVEGPHPVQFQECRRTENVRSVPSERSLSLGPGLEQLPTPNGPLSGEAMDMGRVESQTTDDVFMGRSASEIRVAVPPSHPMDVVTIGSNRATVEGEEEEMKHRKGKKRATPEEMQAWEDENAIEPIADQPETKSQLCGGTPGPVSGANVPTNVRMPVDETAYVPRALPVVGIEDVRTPMVSESGRKYFYSAQSGWFHDTDTFPPSSRQTASRNSMRPSESGSNVSDSRDPNEALIARLGRYNNQQLRAELERAMTELRRMDGAAYVPSFAAPWQNGEGSSNGVTAANGYMLATRERQRPLLEHAHTAPPRMDVGEGSMEGDAMGQQDLEDVDGSVMNCVTAEDASPARELESYVTAQESSTIERQQYWPPLNNGRAALGPSHIEIPEPAQSSTRTRTRHHFRGRPRMNEGVPTPRGLRRLPDGSFRPPPQFDLWSPDTPETIPERHMRNPVSPLGDGRPRRPSGGGVHLHPALMNGRGHSATESGSEVSIEEQPVQRGEDSNVTAQREQSSEQDDNASHMIDISANEPVEPLVEPRIVVAERLRLLPSPVTRSGWITPNTQARLLETVLARQDPTHISAYRAREGEEYPFHEPPRQQRRPFHRDRPSPPRYMLQEEVIAPMPMRGPGVERWLRAVPGQVEDVPSPGIGSYASTRVGTPRVGAEGGEGERRLPTTTSLLFPNDDESSSSRTGTSNSSSRGVEEVSAVQPDEELVSPGTIDVQAQVEEVPPPVPSFQVEEASPGTSPVVEYTILVQQLPAVQGLFHAGYRPSSRTEPVSGASTPKLMSGHGSTARLAEMAVDALRGAVTPAGSTVGGEEDGSEMGEMAVAAEERRKESLRDTPGVSL